MFDKLASSLATIPLTSINIDSGEFRRVNETMQEQKGASRKVRNHLQFAAIIFVAVVAIASTVDAFNPYRHQSTIGAPQHNDNIICSSPTTTLFSYYKHNQEEDNDGSCSSSTSIGDVVQNLHGGKYQFSDTQYLAGSSVMGQQFAESLYSSDDTSSAEGCDEGVMTDEELPMWARRLQDSTEQCSKPILDTLVFDEATNSAASIAIKNDERSWEKYYAFILGNNCNGNNFFRVYPQTGSLAPRGGASNVCDETKPYSDSAAIAIELVGQGKQMIAGADENSNEDWLLVVGTEAEVWRYRLSIGSM